MDSISNNSNITEMNPLSPGLFSHEAPSRPDSKDAGELLGTPMTVVSPSHPGGLGHADPSQGFVSVSSQVGIPLNHSSMSLVESERSGETSRLETNFTPIPLQEGKFSLEKTNQAKALLREKIETARAMRISPTVSFKAEREKSQQQYLKNLEKTLEVITDMPCFDDQETTNSIDGKISRTVNTILELNEAIHNELDELHDATMSERQRIAGEGDYSGIGNAREAVLHFVDYLQELKEGNFDQALESFCLGHKCEAVFKEQKASQENQRDLSLVYKKASKLYAQALEAIKEEAEEFEDLQQAAEMLMLAGKALSQNKKSSALLYQEAGECFYKASQRSQSAENRHNFFQELKECVILRNAGVNFYRAATIANEEGKSILAHVYKQLGTIQSHQAEAIIKKKIQASHYYEEAESLMKDIFDDKNNKDYESTQFLLDAAFYADSIGNVILSEKLVSINYQEAYDLQKLAVSKQLEGFKGIADSYKKAATCSFKATSAQRNGKQILRSIWERTARCYCSLAEEQERGGKDHDPIIQLFKTAVKYHEIEVKEIEEDRNLSKETKVALEEASISFLFAAEALQRGEENLSEAHRNYAKSQYILAVVRTPRLYQYLSNQEKAILGNKEPISSQALIQYWEKGVSSNYNILKQLKAGRLPMEEKYPG